VSEGTGIPSEPEERSWLPPYLRRLIQGPREAADVTGSPRQDIRKGLTALAVFMAAFVGWGLTVPLDAGVFAPGVVTVSGERQTVQQREGGIVSEIDVREGDKVSAGQVVLRLAGAQLEASERAAADQVFDDEALEARLLAETSGRSSFAPPADFAGLTGQDRASADSAMQLQQREFTARAADLATQKAVLAQRERELADEVEGYRVQANATQRQVALIQQETTSLKDLLDRGLVPMTRMRSLQRDAAQLSGAAGQVDADIARTEEQIGETRLQISGLDRQRFADVSKEYGDAQTRLADSKPRLAALRDQLDRLTVRSPASGRVLGLAVVTVGGVVGPGQKLMDIVPSDEPLVVEARVQPNDVSELHPGLATEIRIPAFNDRRMPLLKGMVKDVSADTMTDERTGAAYYRMSVVVPPSQLSVIRQVRGASGGLRPGLPVEVVVPLRPRTALSYLLDPLRTMIWSSFRQR